MNFYFACCYCHAYDYFQEEAKKNNKWQRRTKKKQWKKILPKKRNKEYSMYYVECPKTKTYKKKFNV